MWGKKERWSGTTKGPRVKQLKIYPLKTANIPDVVVSIVFHALPPQTNTTSTRLSCQTRSSHHTRDGTNYTTDNGGPLYYQYPARSEPRYEEEEEDNDCSEQQGFVLSTLITAAQGRRYHWGNWAVASVKILMRLIRLVNGFLSPRSNLSKLA